MKHLIKVNLLILFIMAIALEAAGQVGYYLLKGETVFKRNPFNPEEVFEPHPFLVARLIPDNTQEHEGVVMTTDSESRRNTGAPKDSKGLINVAVLGGSTTMSVGVSDDDTWPAVLQKNLGPEYAVTNYGVAGFTTAENIIQLALSVPSIHPDIVVVYQGWNDITNYHRPTVAPDYYYHGMEQYGVLGLKRMITDKRSFTQRAADYSAVFKGITLVADKLAGRSRHVELRDDPDPRVDELYLRNLKSLKTLANSFGATIVFVPQILNYDKYRIEPGADYWTPRINNIAMPKLMDRFNGFLAQACSPADDNCVVLNEVLEPKWDKDLFIDYGHFNTEGNRIFADILTKQISQYSKPVTVAAQQ